MPKLPLKTPPKVFPSSFVAAAGQSGSNFFVLADSSLYNEYYAKSNVPTLWSPGNVFTHVLHFKDMTRQFICRIPDRIMGMWYSPSDKIYAVGDPSGIFLIDQNGCQEIALNKLPGFMSAIWGKDEDHLFVCGNENSFIAYRKFGKWFELPLPTAGLPPLWAIAGVNEQNVYFVGDEGTILFFDGIKIHQLDSPTTRHLTGIVALDTNHLCVSGYLGTLLYGNQNGWRLVPTDSDDHIRKLARLGSRVFYAANGGVWAFDGKSKPIKVLNEPAAWVDGVNDGIIISDFGASSYYDEKVLIKLDTDL